MPDPVESADSILKSIGSLSPIQTLIGIGFTCITFLSVFFGIFPRSERKKAEEGDHRRLDGGGVMIPDFLLAGPVNDAIESVDEIRDLLRQLLDEQKRTTSEMQRNNAINADLIREIQGFNRGNTLTQQLQTEIRNLQALYGNPPTHSTKTR